MATLAVSVRLRRLCGCLTLLLGLAAPCAWAAPPSVEGKVGDALLPVDLAPLLGSEEGCNAVDLWLVEIARSDGHPGRLDERDFLRAVPQETVASFLCAADRYVNARWIRGDRSDWIVTEFLDTLGELRLPAYYTIFLLNGHTDIGQLRRGHILIAAPYRWHFASNHIQDHDVRWNLEGLGIGGAVNWPWKADPFQVTWPLAYLGIGVRALRGSGNIYDGDVRLGSTNLFELAFQVQAAVRYTVNPWLTLHLDGATGFTLGTLRVARKELDAGLEDPCKIDDARGLDLNAASVAVRCSVNNSFGFYHAFPVEVGVGTLLWGWLDVSARYGFQSIVTDRSQFSPGSFHSLTAQFGVLVH